MKEGTVTGNIGRDPKDRMLMRVFPDGEQENLQLRTTRYWKGSVYVTLVQCELETGRTHQIRVHMKQIGHAL